MGALNVISAMNTFRKLRLFFILSVATLAILCTAFIAVPVPTYAAGSTTTGGDLKLIDDYGEASTKTQLGTSSPAEITATLISAFLGILGLIALVLIIYSGWTWMTAGGNKEKVQEAQERIRNATIGLAIILASYSISLWIFSNVEKATDYGDQETTPTTMIEHHIA